MMQVCVYTSDYAVLFSVRVNDCNETVIKLYFKSDQHYMYISCK